jgi:hypothetical protein
MEFAAPVQVGSITSRATVRSAAEPLARFSSMDSFRAFSARPPTSGEWRLFLVPMLGSVTVGELIVTYLWRCARLLSRWGALEDKSGLCSLLRGSSLAVCGAAAFTMLTE